VLADRIGFLSRDRFHPSSHIRLQRRFMIPPINKVFSASLPRRRRHADKCEAHGEASERVRPEAASGPRVPIPRAGLFPLIKISRARPLAETARRRHSAVKDRQSEAGGRALREDNVSHRPAA